MGLDITAYSKLRHIGEHEIDPELNDGEPGPWCYYENHVRAYAYVCFPASFRGVPILRTETLGGADFLQGGCYETTDGTETIGFRAGSYGGYNRWRQNLSDQFNPPAGCDSDEPDPELPFYELIWFADNEGTIGPEAPADLLADFREHADRFTWPDDPNAEWWREKYVEWTRAFELAADGGLVDFH